MHVACRTISQLPMAEALSQVAAMRLAGAKLYTVNSATKVWSRLSSTKHGPSTAYSAVIHRESPQDLPESVTKEIARAQRNLLDVYVRPPLVLTRGKGMYVWDTQGRQYLDFTGGIAVNALGHADTEFVKALADQAATLSHTSNVFYNPWAMELAELLITLTQRDGGLGYAPGSNVPGDAKVFFSSTGTEANEGALKIARKVGKDRWAARHDKHWDDPSCTKWKITCFENSFHGRSMGSLSVTGTLKYRKPFMPLIPGVEFGNINKIDELSTTVNEDTCAVIAEPIQGEGGINVADENWLRVLRKRCDEVGAVLIYDEIQCGTYRTGSLWAHSKLPVDCHPDMITIAKPLANGYPIGAVMMRNEIAESMGPGLHGTTFGGSPLACSLGLHVLKRLSEPSFGESIRNVGTHLKERLSLLHQWFPSLISSEGIRGRGLILGIPFVPEKAATAPAELVRMARERGLLLVTAGSDAVRIVPSLTVTRADVDRAADVIESVLGEMSK